ncbi:MAG: hypothetical protein LC733_07170 [Actinobacteria bacterium]|nr:hypothetical protein [Actinomycetota bacterium]
MFDDRERFVLLMLLWNFKQSADAGHSVDVPAEEAEAARAQMERINEIVKKLGGDPTKPAFGAVAV